MINANKKKIGYLLIALAIILLLLSVFIFLQPDKNPFKKLIDSIKSGQEKEKTEEEKFNEMIQEKKESFIYTFDEESEKNRDYNENDFKQLARSFAERFGSYSNQSNYGNIEDLKILMSSKMKIWANDYVKELRNNNSYSGSFYGITTKSLIEPSLNNFSLESGKVEVLLSVQREEISTSEPKLYNQDIKIVFIKESGEWLVDEAIWQ